MAEKIRVLYVDDEQNLLELCKVFLERSGNFIVTTSTGASEAIRILELAKFDAIVSDYQMPEMNGIEFLKVVRARGDKTPFVIFTGKGREEVVIEALNAGADFYIQKGGEPKSQFAELAHKIKKGVEGTEAEEAVRKKETRLRTYFNMSMYGIAITSAEKGWLEVNDRICSMLGYTRDELFHKSWAELTHPDDLAADVEQFNRAIRGQIEQYSLDKRFIRKDGGVIWTNISVGVVRKTDGNVDYFICFIGDITERKQAEAAIAESEKKFRTIFDAAQDGMLIADIETRRFVMVNKAMLELTRYPETDLLNLSVPDIIPPADLPSSIEQYEKQVRREINRSSGIPIQRKDGTVFFADITSSMVTLHGRQCTLGIFRDVTVRKASEQALTKSQNQLTDAMDLAHMANWEFDVASGIFTFNDRFYAMYGTTAEREGGYEMPAEVYAREFVHPDEVDVVAQEVQNSITTTDPNYTRQIEHRIIRRDGEIRHIIVRFRITKDAEGRTVKTHGANQDITDRIEAEEALQTKERQLSSIFNNVSEVLYFLSVEPDLRFRFISINKQFLDVTGLSENQVAGRYVDEVIPEPSLSVVLENYKQAIRENKTVRWYEVTPYPSGTKYGHVAITPIYDGNGRCTNLIGSVHDITELKMAEEELRRSQERYREFFTTARDCIFITSPKGKWIDFNNVAIDLFGYSTREELADIPIQDLYENADTRTEFNAKIIRDGYVEDYPVRLKRKDGTVIDALITSVPLRADNGSVKAFIGTIRDVTKQKRAEQEIRTLQQFQQSIIDNANVWISVLDPKGTILVWNNTAEQISGYPAEEVIGKNTVWKQIYPDPVYRKQVAENILDITKKNTYVENFETRIRTKNGDEKIIWWNTQPLRDASGKAIRFIAIGRDNTERTKADEVLRESGRKLQEAQEMAHLGFWSWDVKTGRVEWSDEVFRIFGLDPTEFTPQIDSILALSPWPEDQQRDKELIRRAIESREPGTYEQRFLRPDNSTGYYYSTFQGRYDDGNNLISIVGTVLDITERKRVEEELQVTKEKYTKAFLSVPDAITISELESGRFIEVNDAASTLFGYTRDELVNKSAIDLGIWVNKEERDAFVDQIKKEGRVVQSRVAERRKSGELFNASITADTITIGNTRYLIAATRDITQRKQMEEALRESETRYKNIVEDQTEFISRFLPDGTHVFVNDAYCRYFKKTREEIMGHLFVPDIPQEDRKIVRQHFQSLTPDNPVASVDHRIIMPNGSVRWQRWSDRAIFDNTGKIIEYQSVGRDITDTKLVERELKNSEHLRQDIIDHLPDPTFVINAQGTVIAWNKAMEELAGVPAREMVGKGNYEYALPFYGVRQPILIDLALQYDEEVWKKYDSIQRDGKTLVAETTNARPRGQPAVLWGKASPVYDENGRIIGAIETIRNITERKRMEDVLRESEERYSSIFDNNYSVSLLIDPDTGKIVEANAAAVRYYGYSHDELTRLGIYDLNRLPKDKIVRDLQQAKHEKAKHFFSTHYLASEKKRNVEIYSGPITIQGKSYFYSIIHDITERKQAEEALALASKKLSLLSSITRHDILNQLTVLRGYIDLSEDMLNDPVKMREFLEKEETAAATIEEQITFTRNYQDMGVKAPTWQNVNTSIEKAQKQFLMRDVRVDVDCTDLDVYADPLFEKVFYNLIDNALRYGGDCMKAIRVHCQESNNGLVITCEDNGVGITQEDKKRLFTRGFGKNTGLGLFLTREILGITDITITENGETGKGAKFEITVPKDAYRFTGTGGK